MSENLRIYEAVRNVPASAIRPIQAGRLKGKSNINPMWRIKKLTEMFGPCGIGWYYEIVREWTEAGAGDAIAAFVDINLYYKWEGEWSKPIPGTGGSMFVAPENGGPHTSDECYKMALTDAISVSAKAIGIGADVHWSEDATKYSKQKEAEKKQDPPKSEQAAPVTLICPKCHRPITGGVDKSGKKWSAEELHNEYGVCAACKAKEQK